MSEYGETYRHVTGNVTNDPKTYDTKNPEVKILKFGLAETDGFGDAAVTRFYDIAVWNEGLQAWARSEVYKGQKITVAGRFSIDTYKPETPRLQINADQVGIVQYGTRTRKGEKAAELVSTSAGDSLNF